MALSALSAPTALVSSQSTSTNLRLLLSALAPQGIALATLLGAGGPAMGGEAGTPNGAFAAPYAYWARSAQALQTPRPSLSAVLQPAPRAAAPARAALPHLAPYWWARTPGYFALLANGQNPHTPYANLGLPRPALAGGQRLSVCLELLSVPQLPKLLWWPLTPGAARPALVSQPRPLSRLTAGLGLDETRLVRGGTSRLADPALISGKLPPLGVPALVPHAAPSGLSGLAWSTAVSLTTYPSYKLSRGSLPRRPHCGPEAATSAVKGLPEAFPALMSGKVPTGASLALLALFDVPRLRPRTAAPSLDTQAAAWVLARPVLTPVPCEDLDPTFINTRWALETNTARRSDHNSRYLVSWSPLLAPLTTPASPVNMALAGPGTRQGIPAGKLRTSMLALNELGLKNIRGAHRALLAQGAGSCAVVTTAGHRGVEPLLQ